MIRKALAAGAAAALTGAVLVAQGGRPASPAGSSAIQVLGKYEPGSEGPVYRGGKWIEITYGRPIKRGRTLFGGAGADYGKTVNPDAPVWRAGANNTTQLKTEVPIVINGKTLAPGTYTIFVDLKPNNWTFIASTHVAQTRYDPNNKTDKDIIRLAMRVENLPHAFEQLSWEFLDVSDAGGTLAVMWDKTMATLPFKVGS
jgi:hypothetical protein